MTKNQPDILQILWKTRLETLLCWAVCELKRRVKVAYSCRSDSLCDFSESILEGKKRLHVFRFGVIIMTNNPQKTTSHNFRVKFYHFWMRKAAVSHFQTQFRKNQTRFLFPRSPDIVRMKVVGEIFLNFLS